MRKTVISAVLFSLITISFSASAADRMKPGLWSMAVKSDAMKSIPKMPPAQMEQMKKMGINLPEVRDDGAMVMKVCMTKEMTERDGPPQAGPRDTGCEMKNYTRSGDSYSVDMVCDGPNLKGTGKATGKHASAESFTSTYDFKGTAHGQPTTQHHESTGKWLSDDCGSVKPATDYMPKK
ncbi:hypothetical protein BH11PSE11_BH11PSE11_31940 [soil metagenome]